MYAVFSLGAVAVWWLLPRRDVSRARITAGVIAAALAGAVALSAACTFAPLSNAVLFYVFAATALLAAVRVITHTKPVYSAVYFVGLVLSVAALLVLLEAEFLAAALVVIYAGAILVTYLFVIMLAQQPDSPTYDRASREPFLGVLFAFLLTGLIGGHVAGVQGQPPGAPRASTAASAPVATPTLDQPMGNSESVGVALLIRYPVALEMAGILLLVSMIGAISLSRKRVPAEAGEARARPLGEAGRAAEPF